ncbi:MAG: hypothetical protein ABI366_07220 [Ginsengibacter sp.]
MRKATKRSVILSCVFVLLTAFNLIMEYKKSNPDGLIFSWIMLAVFVLFAIVAFIRYKRQSAEEIKKPD